MTFLELCQHVRRESRVTGTGPATVRNQRGILDDIVQATRNAWVEIQNLHPDWTFLERTVDTPLVLNRADQPFNGLNLTRYARLKRVLLDGRPMGQVAWDDLLVRHRSQPIPEQAPSVYALPPEGDRLVFDTKPIQTQTLTIQYYEQPTLLKDNSDRPGIQEQLQWAIVWKAVADISANESDSTIYQKAFEKYDNTLALMSAQYLPPVTLGRWV